MFRLAIIPLLLNFITLYPQESKLDSQFHKERRDEVRKKMPENSVAVFFSSPIRNRSNSVDFLYHQDRNFYYLTGWREPHGVLLIYKNQQEDEEGFYNEKIYVRERDAYREMWDGKRKGVEGALKMGFDRVSSRKDFKKTNHAFSSFASVLLFDFNNDVRDFKNDPNDLYDLKQFFREEINFPDSFDPIRYRIYKRIKDFDYDQIDILKDEINFYVERDESLLDDPNISAFLESQNKEFYGEVKKRTSLKLKDYNFDVDLLPGIMTDLRERKTAKEIGILRKAVSISVIGQIEVMKAMKPGMSESEIQGIHEFVFKKYGVPYEGYPSIVGAGGNGCILHYIDNNDTAFDNQLVLMDVGAEHMGYTADVTRTIPANGKYSNEQRELYEIVYEAQSAGIESAVVGAKFSDVYQACYNVIASGLLRLGIIGSLNESERYREVRKYFPHGVAHHIGLDVHDPGNYQVLEPEMIITVEPGIYIPAGSNCDPKWWNIGIRIEDDILITSKGPENLSRLAPRKWEEIEEIMKLDSALESFVLPEIN
ncbi:MAG: Xaa-Pro aminopeptidase [Flavobacteriaceae bacterium]|nr:Xaa-Pro aminopeptidase [Flavobacteriaceae bacterium]|tara:strand:+ start:14862 stop:16478 length:1617 start_codon:yes stop_codon:yes gene_type:complete